jgi:hypothetical protein
MHQKGCTHHCLELSNTVKTQLYIDNHAATVSDPLQNKLGKRSTSNHLVSRVRWGISNIYISRRGCMIPTALSDTIQGIGTLLEI